MKFSRSFDRKINRNDNSSPYRRSKSPKSGPLSTEKSWSVTGFFKFLRNITTSITSNDRENELPRYRTDSHITPSSSGSSSAAVEVILNENKTHNQNQLQNTFSNSTPQTQRQPQIQTEVPQSQQEVIGFTSPSPDSTSPASPEAVPASGSSILVDGNNTNSTFSQSNTTNRILHWAMAKVADGRPVNVIEVIGLRAVLNGQENQQREDVHEPEKLSLAPERVTSSQRTPGFSLNNTLPTFTNNESSNAGEPQRKRKMLKRDPNGALYWRGAGRARVRPASILHQQQRASTFQAEKVEFSKRRRVLEEEGISGPSTTASAETTAPSGSGLLSRPGEMPMPDRLPRPTVVRPRTTPAVSSPLRNIVANGGSSSSKSGSSTTPAMSSGGGVSASKGFAVNLMEEVIKNNTPPKKPDVGNPYQAAAPVKPSVQSSSRTKSIGRKRESSIEVVSRTSDGKKKEKETERVLSAKDIIEATVPKGAKRSRPTASDLKKARVNTESYESAFTPNPTFSIGVGSSFGSAFPQPIIEEPEDEEGPQAKRQKKARRTVTIEELDDNENTIPSSYGFGKTAKTSSPHTTPSEIIEPKEGSSSGRSSSKNTLNNASINGNNSLKMTNGVLGKTSNLPREPSKLRKSFVADEENENENVELKGFERKKGASKAPFSAPAFAAIPTSPFVATAKTSTSHFATPEMFKSAFPKSGTTHLSNMTTPSGPLGVIQEKGDIKEFVRQLSLMELPKFVFSLPEPGCVFFPGKTSLGKRQMDNVMVNVMEMPVRKLPRFDFAYKAKGAVNGFVPKTTGGINISDFGATATSSYKASTSAPVPAPSVGFNWAKAGMKPPSDPTKEGKWVCGECTLTNDDPKAVKCSICDARRPEPKMTSSTSSSSLAIGSTMSMPSAGFDWAKAGMKPPTDPTKEGKWVCGECTLTNDDTKAMKCTYCDSRRPEPKAKMTTNPSSSATGSTTSMPSAGFDWAKAGMKPPTDPTKEGKWVCGECTLVNDNTKAVKCAYCDAQRPGSASNASSNIIGAPASAGFDWAKAGMKPPSDPTKEGKWICGEYNDSWESASTSAPTFSYSCYCYPSSTGFNFEAVGMTRPIPLGLGGDWSYKAIINDAREENMPQKVVTTPYPLIDSDPHAFRVVRYFRPSDYAAVAAGTAAFPAALYFWDMADPTHLRLRTSLRLSGVLGFVGGFLLAYQRSSFRFWGWSENKREEEMDLAELKQRVAEGKPLYGESDQPLWVQNAAHNSSAFSQLKLHAFPWFNLVNHPYHGTDPAKYGVETEKKSDQ